MPASRWTVSQEGKAASPFSAALRMLAARPYSVAELRRALQRKFPSNPDVSSAIARLRELGYLDDKKFAEHYAYSLASRRGFGPHRIRRELKAKLVDYRTIEPALRRLAEEIDERDLLDRALKKKLRTLRLPLTPSRLASLCQSLLRRGFSAGDIMKAVRSQPALKPVAEDADLAELEEQGRVQSDQL